MVDSAYELLLYNTLYLIREFDPNLPLERINFLIKDLSSGKVYDETLSKRFEILLKAICEMFSQDEKFILNKMSQFNPEVITIKYESL